MWHFCLTPAFWPETEGSVVTEGDTQGWPGILRNGVRQQTRPARVIEDGRQSSSGWGWALPVILAL